METWNFFVPVRGGARIARFHSSVCFQGSLRNQSMPISVYNCDPTGGGNDRFLGQAIVDLYAALPFDEEVFKGKNYKSRVFDDWISLEGGLSIDAVVRLQMVVLNDADPVVSRLEPATMTDSIDLTQSVREGSEELTDRPTQNNTTRKEHKTEYFVQSRRFSTISNSNVEATSRRPSYRIWTRLTLEVLEARDIIPRDVQAAHEIGPFPNTYCFIDWHGKIFSTRAIAHDLNPSWNSTKFVLDLQAVDYDCTFPIHIRDYDPVKCEDVGGLGAVDIDLCKLKPNSPVSVWLPIRDGRGELKVSLLLHGDEIVPGPWTTNHQVARIIDDSALTHEERADDIPETRADDIPETRAAAVDHITDDTEYVEGYCTDGDIDEAEYEPETDEFYARPRDEDHFSSRSSTSSVSSTSSTSSGISELFYGADTPKSVSDDEGSGRSVLTFAAAGSGTTNPFRRIDVESSDLPPLRRLQSKLRETPAAARQRASVISTSIGLQELEVMSDDTKHHILQDHRRSSGAPDLNSLDISLSKLIIKPRRSTAETNHVITLQQPLELDLTARQIALPDDSAVTGSPGPDLLRSPEGRMLSSSDRITARDTDNVGRRRETLEDASSLRATSGPANISRHTGIDVQGERSRRRLSPDARGRRAETDISTLTKDERRYASISSDRNQSLERRQSVVLRAGTPQMCEGSDSSRESRTRVPLSRSRSSMTLPGTSLPSHRAISQQKSVVSRIADALPELSRDAISKAVIRAQGSSSSRHSSVAESTLVDETLRLLAEENLLPSKQSDHSRRGYRSSRRTELPFKEFHSPKKCLSLSEVQGKEFSVNGNSSVESSGRKRALLIGCYYPALHERLSKTLMHQEVTSARHLIENHFGVPPDSLTILESVGTNASVGKRSIIRGFDWLSDAASEGDALVLYFSGYRSISKESISSIMVSDDGAEVSKEEMLLHLHCKLPPGCRLTCLFDYHQIPSDALSKRTSETPPSTTHRDIERDHLKASFQYRHGCLEPASESFQFPADIRTISMKADDTQSGPTRGPLVTSLAAVLSTGSNATSGEVMNGLKQVTIARGFRNCTPVLSCSQTLPLVESFSFGNIRPNSHRLMGQRNNSVIGSSSRSVDLLSKQESSKPTSKQADAEPQLCQEQSRRILTRLPPREHHHRHRHHSLHRHHPPTPPPHHPPTPPPHHHPTPPPHHHPTPPPHHHPTPPPHHHPTPPPHHHPTPPPHHHPTPPPHHHPTPPPHHHPTPSAHHHPPPQQSSHSHFDSSSPVPKPLYHAVCQPAGPPNIAVHHHHVVTKVIRQRDTTTSGAIPHHHHQVQMVKYY